MKIVDFILSKITPRLRQRRLLVVYDSSGRFKPVAEMLAQKQKALYLDASTHLLEALKTTHFALQAGLKQPVVIYVPHPKPETLEQKLKDPFAGFSEIGAQFPATGADDYEQLCLLALPKKEAAIRDVFAHSDPLRGPDFELIEPLFEDGSVKWPSMRALSHTTGRCVGLSVVNKDNFRICIALIDNANEEIRLSTPLNTPLPLHKGATGKMLWAHLSEPKQLQVYRENAHEIPESWNEVHMLLNKIRDKGYFFSSNERLNGACSLAAPIISNSGDFIAALTISAVQLQFTPAEVQQYTMHLLETTKKISIR